MTLRPYEQGDAAGPVNLVPQEQPEPTWSGQLKPYLGAAFRQYNDVYNLWDLLSRPAYNRDPNFDALKRTQESPFWNDHRDSFVGAESQQEWDAIAGRIVKEEKDKRLLASAPLAVSLGAGLFAGVASPLSFVPALTPIRGLRGIAAAAALGASAAAMQEIPLQLNQETRTGEDALESIAAGTLLGGIIGAGAQALDVPSAIGRVFRDTRRQFENDMARTRGDTAIHLPKDEYGLPSPHTDDAIHFSIGNIEPRVIGGAFSDEAARLARNGQPETVTEISRADLVNRFPDNADALNVKAATKFVTDEVSQALDENRPVRLNVAGNEIKIKGVDKGVLTAEDGQKFDIGEALQSPLAVANKLLVDRVPTDGATLTQIGPLVQTPSAVPAADASLAVPRSGGAAANPNLREAGALKGGKVIKALAKVSPVAATIAQSRFPRLRSMMSKLSTAGLRLEGNADFIPANRGGTVEANIATHERHIANMIKVMDDYYTDYFYQGKTQPAFPTTRASLQSTFRMTGNKLTREQFNREVARAAFEADEHPVSQVSKAASLLRKVILEPIDEESRKVGLLEESNLADPSYFPRQWDQKQIASRTSDLVDKLTAWNEKDIAERLASSSNRLKEQRKILDEYISDVEADDAAIATRREEFQARLEALGESDEEVQIKSLQREQRELRKQKFERYADDKARRERLDEIKAQVKTLKETVGPRSEEKRYIWRRLRNLNRSYLAVAEKRASKLERIDRVEDDALNSLRSVLRRGRQMGKQLDKVKPAVLKKQVNNFIDRVEQAEQTLEKRHARIAAAQNDPDLARYHDTVLREAEPINKGTARLADLRGKLLDAIEMDETAPVIREIIEDIAAEANERVNALNLRRGARIAKLEEDAKNLTPERVREHVEEAKGKQVARETRALERFREMGLDDVDLENGTASITALAKDQARRTVSKIQGHGNRITGMNVVGEERGHSLERTLSIPSKEVYDFLTMDAERVLRNYIREVGADIEIKRAFGDVNAKTAFADAETEYHNIAEKMAKDGASEKELRALEQDYTKYKKYIEATISRLRHTWGIPNDPDSFAARAGKILLDLNTMRFMGTVAISSIPDLARVVMVHGLRSTFRDAFIPMIKDWKQFKAASRDLARSGVGVDALTHSRAMAFTDVMDEYMGHTAPERLIHTAANKIGVIAVFDYWTDFMKQIDGVMNTSKLMDSLSMINEGTASAKEMKEATELLAQYGFDESLARQVWSEVEKGGANKVNGFWMPNTEDWADDSRRVFDAALKQMSNDHIITPGVEIPLWMNSSVPMRMLTQFKSFSMSSHTKMLMAGMQQKDMRMLNGVLSSVSLGMASYWIWANTVGGEAKKNMENASFDQWLDEGISRSGILASFGEVQRVAERIPALAPYANFSGKRGTRRAGSDLTEALLGPSFDFLSTASGVATGIDDPTKSTLHQTRTLLPFQNVFWFRRLFDMLEDALSQHLPEKRERNSAAKLGVN